MRGQRIFRTELRGGRELGGRNKFPDMVEAIAKNVSRIIMYAEEIAERLFEEREMGFERWPHWWKKAESVAAGAWQERFRVRVVKS